MTLKNRRKSLFGIAKTTLFILLGNAMLAFAVAAFVIPHDIIMGGTTGIGIVLNKTLSIDTAALILVLNLILLAFGGIVLGRKFFLTTIASSVLYPVMLGVIERIPGVASFTENTLLAALFGGSMMGISLGMLMRIGSSTGGMDVVILVLHKWFHISVSVLLILTDAVVIGGQALFEKPEALLLGVITLVCETLMIEQVIILGKSQIQVYVVSDHYEEIRGKILKEAQVGVTMTLIETGQFRQSQKGVLCVISPRKLHAVTEMIQSVDPAAFITITKIKEVRGRGFTLERYVQNGPEE